MFATKERKEGRNNDDWIGFKKDPVLLLDMGY